MRTFKDTNGLEWTVAVNVDTIKRVRDMCKINLYSILEDENALLKQLSADYILLADVLYATVHPQARERSISDEQFGKSLSGDVLWNGFNALLDDLVDFFPDPRRRAVLGKMIAKMREATGMILDESEKEIDAIDLKSEVQTMLKILSGNSPASSGATPAP